MLFKILGFFFGIIGFIALLQIIINKTHKGFWGILTLTLSILSLSFFGLYYFPEKRTLLFPIVFVSFIVWIFLERQRKEMG